MIRCGESILRWLAVTFLVIVSTFGIGAISAPSANGASTSTTSATTYDAPANSLQGAARDETPAHVADTSTSSPDVADAAKLIWFSSEFVAAKSGLSTGSSEAVFWSGIRGGESTAAGWAAKNGGTTLEMTAGGKALPAFDSGNAASMAAWRQASAGFARGASGDVRVLQADSVRTGSVWAQVEYPALRANPNVTSITSINPQSGAEVLLWAR